jgi:hypothetical protein
MPTRVVGDDACKLSASCADTDDLPTPPLPEQTIMNRLISFSRRAVAVSIESVLQPFLDFFHVRPSPLTFTTMAPPSRKKARTGKKPVNAQNATGRLSELPLDILLEVKSTHSQCAHSTQFNVAPQIFRLLHPLDIFHLSRISKSFRTFLTSSSSKKVWQTAFDAVDPGFPKCPKHLSFHRYVQLAFHEICDVIFYYVLSASKVIYVLLDLWIRHNRISNLELSCPLLPKLQGSPVRVSNRQYAWLRIYIYAYCYDYRVRGCIPARLRRDEFFIDGENDQIFPRTPCEDRIVIGLFFLSCSLSHSPWYYALPQT